MRLSVCLITLNEESNICRTLDSVKEIADEIIVVDSGSTDETAILAEARGAKVFVEEWKGYARQKNSALAKAGGDWILYLDADEELSPELAATVKKLLKSGAPPPPYDGYLIARRNFYFGRWIKHGGYYPDRSLRLIKRGTAEFELSLFHEEMRTARPTGHLAGDLVHQAYPTLEALIEASNRYSALGAQMVVERRRVGFSIANIVLRPLVAFLQRYFLRLGFLDGCEGLIVQMQYAAYVSWKYAKAWELSKALSEKDRVKPR